MPIRKPSALAHAEGIQSLNPKKTAGSEAKRERIRGNSLVSGSRQTKAGVGVGGAGLASLACDEFKNRTKGDLRGARSGQMPSPHSVSARGSQESCPPCGFQDLSLIKLGPGAVHSRGHN